MNLRRNIFLIIALLYFIVKLIYYFVLRIEWNDSLVTPGWSVSMTYPILYFNWFTPVFFLSIATIYGLKKYFSKTVFILHVIVSTVPLLYLLIWPFIFKNFDFELHQVISELHTIYILEMAFGITQAIFVILLLFSNTNAKRLKEMKE